MAVWASCEGHTAAARRIELTPDRAACSCSAAGRDLFVSRRAIPGGATPRSPRRGPSRRSTLIASAPRGLGAGARAATRISNQLQSIPLLSSASPVRKGHAAKPLPFLELLVHRIFFSTTAATSRFAFPCSVRGTGTDVGWLAARSLEGPAVPVSLVLGWGVRSTALAGWICKPSPRPGQSQARDIINYLPPHALSVLACINTNSPVQVARPPTQDVGPPVLAAV